MKFSKWLLSLVLLFGPSLQAATADYVVVGVGTAGGLMTRRLSDDKETSVIALHNGPYLSNDPLISCSQNAIVTVLSALLGQLDPAISPLYESGFDTANTFWAMALPGGGASSINAGAWCRGTDLPYSQWELIAGPEWSVDRILGIYKGLERYRGKTPNPSSRGFHGPIVVRQDPHPTGVSKVFTQAWIEATGLPFVEDFNNPDTPVGISSRNQYTQRGHHGNLRVSSVTAFLDEEVMTPSGHGKDGRKLRVHFNSTALRTLWDGNRAIGVEYLQEGEIKQVFANKGVIVCGGLFSSAFLMHSGVGPSGVLSGLGIPVIFDNPNVGQGLADQPLIVCAFTSNPADFVENPAGIFQQISWLPVPGGDPTARELLFAATNPLPGLTAGVFNLTQAVSRGFITINSADPTVPPVITLNELANPADVNTYLQGFQVYIQALNQSLQAIDPLYRLVSPDPAILNDNVALTAFIKSSVLSNQCFQCHCRMAPFADGGVVDSHGLVYGTENLYVADDSVCPTPMDGTPMASAYLIAANIAEMILGPTH
jgi:choline dehydrogenase-like flavoprotein